MKWYISGKITGLPQDQVVAKFTQAAEQVISYGHKPVNPLDNGLPFDESWNKHIVADIALLVECDAIYLLSDWKNSKGARIEEKIAQECGLEIVMQPVFAAYKKN